jgi:hypothetical protein
LGLIQFENPGTDDGADPTYADAVVDRLIHNAHRMDLDGENPQTRPQGLQPVALWTFRCAWTTRSALPRCPQQKQQQKNNPQSRDLRLTARLRRCQKPDSQNASRPGRHQIGMWRDHLGILGEIKSEYPGEIIGIRIATECPTATPKVWQGANNAGTDAADGRGQ